MISPKVNLKFTSEMFPSLPTITFIIFSIIINDSAAVKSCNNIINVNQVEKKWTGANAECELFQNDPGKMLLKKNIRCDLEDSEKYKKSCLKSFQTEVAILSHLNNENVQFVPNLFCLSHPTSITVKEYKKSTEPVFMVMDYFNGQTMSEFFAKNRDPQVLRKVVKMVVAAIQELHRHGVIHVDIKPENILTNGSFVNIIDFGGSLAPSLGISDIGFTHYTEGYAMPLKKNEKVTPAYDWYSLGVTVYYSRVVQILGEDNQREIFPFRKYPIPSGEVDLLHFIDTCTSPNTRQLLNNGADLLKKEPYLQ